MSGPASECHADRAQFGNRRRPSRGGPDVDKQYSRRRIHPGFLGHDADRSVLFSERPGQHERLRQHQQRRRLPRADRLPGLPSGGFRCRLILHRPGRRQPGNNDNAGAMKRPKQPMTLGAHLRRVARLFKAREDDGVAAVEFAIYALVFLTVVAAVVDIGLLLFTQSELDAAVSAGAEYAASSATHWSRIRPSIPISRISSTTSTAPAGQPARSTSTTVTTALIAIARPERPVVGRGAARSLAAAAARAAVSAASS
jgi:Flp pilus assembly protein TadG